MERKFLVLLERTTAASTAIATWENRANTLKAYNLLPVNRANAHREVHEPATHRAPAGILDSRAGARGGPAMSDDESDGAPLDDRLLDGLSGLEFLLSASLMPDDFDLEALASCDASAIAECEAGPDIQDRVFGLMARALLVFAEAEASGALGPGEYGLDSQELHGQFVAMLEAEMEKVLRTKGWADPAEFQAALRDALAVGGGSGGAGGEEGRRVRRGAAAAELLELLDGMSRFEPWAEAMKRLGRELLELGGGRTE